MRCCLEQPEVCQLFASIYVSLVHRDDGMRLEWTWFYDDYTMICGDDYASNVPGERSACLSCLGFFLPRKASKPLSLTKLLDLWELFFELTSVPQGCFNLYHTEKTCRSELTTLLQDMLRDRSFASRAIE